MLKSIRWKLLVWRLWFVALFRITKGKHWCRRFHRPIVTSPGGYGGRTIFGRRRREYLRCQCPECGNAWEQSGSFSEVCRKYYEAVGALLFAIMLFTGTIGPILAQQPAMTLSPDMLRVLALVPAEKATAHAIKDGNWSNPATWADGTLPAEGGRVLIDAHVQLDTSPPKLEWIRGRKGSLSEPGLVVPTPEPEPEPDPEPEPEPPPPDPPAPPTLDDLLGFVAPEKQADFKSKFDQYIAANYALLPPAPKAARILASADTASIPASVTLTVGTFVTEDAFAFTWSGSTRLEIVIADLGPVDYTADPYALSRGCLFMGKVDLEGEDVTSYQFIAGAKKGSTGLTLKNPVTNWRVGDRLVIPGTTNAMKQLPWGGDSKDVVVDDDEAVIAAIDGTSITLAAPLQFDHLDANAYGTARPMVVANRERSVSFRSENTKDITRRGHVMCMRDDKMMSQRFQSVGFYGLGRTNKNAQLTDPDGTGKNLENPRARYGLHFHMCGSDTSGMEASVFGCYLEDSPGWGYVNHGSYVCLQHNVAYRVTGAHFVCENGHEAGCIRSNLAIRSVNSRGKLPAENPGNVSKLTINVGDWGKNGSGIWIHAGNVPLTDNLIYGSVDHGLVVMSLVTKAGEGVTFDGGSLSPRQPGKTFGNHEVPQIVTGNAIIGTKDFGLYPWALNGNPSAKAPIARSTFSDNYIEADGGIFVGYSSNLDFSNNEILRAQADYAGTGITHSGVQTDFTWTGNTLRGFNIGHHLGTNLLHVVQDERAQCLYGLFIYSPRPGGVSREIRVTNLQMLPLTQPAPSKTQAPISAQRGEALGMARSAAGGMGGFWGSLTRHPSTVDVITLDGRYVTYSDDGPTFRWGLYAGCPAQWKDMTNAQALADLGFCMNAMASHDGLTPLDPAASAWVSDTPLQLAPVLRVNNTWNQQYPAYRQYTSQTTGYVPRVLDDKGVVIPMPPVDLLDKTWNVVRTPDGRGVPVYADSTQKFAPNW